MIEGNKRDNPVIGITFATAEDALSFQAETFCILHGDHYFLFEGLSAAIRGQNELIEASVGHWQPINV